MLFTKKKIVSMSVGIALLGTVAYGGLMWWQLQTFDKMGETLSVRNMGFFALEQERLGGDWFHRDLALRIGFREDDGLSEVFLEMNGRFTPGLFPSIRFTAVPVADPERAIFVKANPRASIDFNALMQPKEAEIHWVKASEGSDVVSDGHIVARLDVDVAKKDVRSFSVNASLGASETMGEGGKVYFGEKSFVYDYQASPRTLTFSYVSEGDKAEGEVMPIMFGPFEYQLKISPQKEGDIKGNLTDIEFKAKEVRIYEEGLPPLNTHFSASMLTPEDVWLPCLSAQLFLGSVTADLPGICPSGTLMDPFAIMGQGPIHGEIRDFSMTWAGTDIKVKGKFVNHGLPKASFDVTAEISDLSKKKDVPVAATILTQDLKRYVEALEEEGAVKKTSESDYQTTLEFGLTPEGLLKMTANGQDLTQLKASFEITSPFFDPSVILITVTPLKEPYLSKGIEDDVIVPLEKVLMGLDDVMRWSSIQSNDKSQVLQIIVEDPDKTEGVIKVLDERLTKLKETVGEAVDLEMRYPDVVPEGTIK